MQEPVNVDARFLKGKLVPLRFSWRQTVFPVEKIHLVHVSRFGRDTLYHFGVESRQMVYELTFNNQTLAWRLVRIYEGNLTR